MRQLLFSEGRAGLGPMVSVLPFGGIPPTYLRKVGVSENNQGAFSSTIALKTSTKVDNRGLC